MLIATDYHHAAAAAALRYTLEDRLGHNVRFPGIAFAEWVTENYDRSWVVPCPPAWMQHVGGNMELDGSLYSVLDFLDTNWDAVIVTRPEMVQVYDALLSRHPAGKNIKRILCMGNQDATFDWSWSDNFMSSDYLSYMRSPAKNKLWYSQELAPQFQNCPWREIRTEEVMRTINCFINFWPDYTELVISNIGQCAHCGGSRSTARVLVSPYELWSQVSHNLSGTHTFASYGLDTRYGPVSPSALPSFYTSGAYTIHLKHVEGYGFSLLQSIACGRPAIVPRGFYRYRTAGKYLIPGLTCFEVDWKSRSITDTIEQLTCDLDTVNAYSWHCWKAAKALFNWELEAMRVKEFMEKLR